MHATARLRRGHKKNRPSSAGGSVASAVEEGLAGWSPGGVEVCTSVNNTKAKNRNLVEGVIKVLPNWQ